MVPSYDRRGSLGTTLRGSESPPEGFSTASGGRGRVYDYEGSGPVFVAGQKAIAGKDIPLVQGVLKKAPTPEHSYYFYIVRG